MIKAGLKALSILCLLGSVLWFAVAGKENDLPPAETTAGWVKYPKNPVLGGDLGTCFDVSVLKEGDAYRMWFSWRPKKSIALVESKDGIQWSKPVIVLGPNEKTDWENDLNRPVVIKNGDRYQMWYTGQARGKSWIGYATSKDGKTWKRDERQARSFGGKAVGEGRRDVSARPLRRQGQALSHVVFRRRARRTKRHWLCDQRGRPEMGQA